MERTADERAGPSAEDLPKAMVDTYESFLGQHGFGRDIQGGAEHYALADGHAHPCAERGLSVEARALRVEFCDLEATLAQRIVEGLRAARADALEEAARINEELAAAQRAKDNLEAAGWLTIAARKVRASEDDS